MNALQVLVSRLRRVLPEGSVEAKSGGYRLVAESEAVDVARFEHLVSRAREADDPERVTLLRSALELWRGEAMEGIELQGSRAFDAAIAGLGERRLAVLGDRVEAEIRLGRGADLVSELTDLVARYPLREGLAAALMRALAEAGRGAEALTEYRRLSERLADELGADPRPSCRRCTPRCCAARSAAAPSTAGRTCAPSSPRSWARTTTSPLSPLWPPSTGWSP
ncbi:hypothetical protein GCM10029992_14050 [Glycomyces albus]